MAIINVTPTTDINTLIQSNNVSEGDVLLLEDGEYFQTINVTKNFIRIVAKSNNVVFNGKSMLVGAFNLIDVSGVEIFGISIMHYRGNGIFINGGSGNRIVDNRINSVLNNGISISSSHDNLIWKNEICNAGDGIFLGSGSTNNRIIENSVKECLDDGYETFFENDSNNVFISNTAIDNGGYGLHIFGINNLLHNNILINNRLAGIHVNIGNNTVAINNIVNNSQFMGVRLLDHPNLFFGQNRVVDNKFTGIGSLTRVDNGTFYNNTVMHNTDIGLILNITTNSNFVYDNKFRCNIPFNISNTGTNNTLLNISNNPCKPCDLKIEYCNNDSLKPQV